MGDGLMRHWIIIAAALAELAPGAARADWLEASSPHFVIYANDSERDLTRFSENLELYHQAMEAVTGVHAPDPSPSNRVTVFVVNDQRQVQKVLGGNARYVGGFYMPRAGRPFAVVPQVQVLKGQQAYSMITLMHEYAHHFLISNSSLPTPRWMGEGAAEFFASAEFPGDGAIKIGMPAYQRAGELFYAKDVSVEQLLDPSAYNDGEHKGFDAFYGRSWLLYHYLVMGGTRTGQLRKYTTLMAAGKSSLEAGREVFGDLEQLQKELDKYLMQSKLTTVAFGPGKLPIGKVSVRPLSAGEAAVMPLLIRSVRGVDRAQATELVGEVREVAAQYPQDAGVLTELAEAEYDAGNDDKAIAAADAALALDPQRVNAYVQKGYALFRKAANADRDKASAYKVAVAPFLALNKLENDNPLPLIYYYRSFAERGVKPPDQAVLGLMRAAELAPYDLGLRLNLAEYDIETGRYAAARGNLVPIAYDPHGSPLSAGARTLIERIDGGKPPTGAEAVQIMDSAQKAAVTKGAEGGAG
jgi:tetratricopeptide (TPR) repeat protein